MKPYEAKRKIGALNKHYYKNINALIDAGMGHLKPSDMRKMKDRPKLVEEHLTYLAKFAELREFIVDTPPGGGES